MANSQAPPPRVQSDKDSPTNYCPINKRPRWRRRRRNKWSSAARTTTPERTIQRTELINARGPRQRGQQRISPDGLGLAIYLEWSAIWVVVFGARSYSNSHQTGKVLAREIDLAEIYDFTGEKQIVRIFTKKFFWNYNDFDFEFKRHFYIILRNIFVILQIQISIAIHFDQMAQCQSTKKKQLWIAVFWLRTSVQCSWKPFDFEQRWPSERIECWMSDDKKCCGCDQ